MSRPRRARGLDGKAVALAVVVGALGLGAGLVVGELALLGVVLLVQVGLLVYVRRVGALMAARLDATRLQLDRERARSRDRAREAARDRRALMRELGRVTSAATALEAEQERAAQRLGEVETSIEHLSIEVGRRPTVHQLRVELRHQYEQIDALQALYHEVRPAGALPAMDGWAAAPDLLRFTYQETLRRQPRRIVECGSGVSTVLMAHALERIGADGRIIVLEHVEEYLERTRALLAQHGLSRRVDLRMAPLEVVEVADREYRWYARDHWPAETIDLLFVDGPPGKIQPHSRLPAVPLLYDRLSEDALVILDDYGREEEKEVVAWWCEHYPDLRHRVLPHQKGTALLSRERTGPDPGTVPHHPPE